MFYKDKKRIMNKGNPPLVLNRLESQAIDKQCSETYGIPSIILMENAGRGIVDAFLSLNPKDKVVICCGGGNNGGDGFVVARHLDNRNIPVHVLLCVEPLTLKGDAKVNYEIVLKSGIPLTVICSDDVQPMKQFLSEASWIIDALFGTGLKGEVKSPLYQMIQLMNESKKSILSIDIPSGLDCDTGEVLGIAIQATHTFTMVALKRGFGNPKATTYLGKVNVVDISAPRVLLEKFR